MVVVVVVGTACHWAYRVKSAVWLCDSPAVIWVPPEAAVCQPVKVYPVRVGSVGSVVIEPPVVVVASPSVTVEPPWLSYVILSEVDIEYTRTCPALVPFPSFKGAPIATLVPSEDNDTDHPDLSPRSGLPAVSPLMSAPSCDQVPLEYWCTRTCPALVPFPSF